MIEMLNKFNLELACIIVEYGSGSKVLHFAKSHGCSGGTVVYGKGSVNGSILCFLGLSEVRKEIIFIIADRHKIRYFLDAASAEFKFDKQNHGIAFTTSIENVLGTKYITCEDEENEDREEKIMYHVITSIVDKGKGEDVISSASRAGSKGGTIINARGSGVHETSKVFSMEIEPEKEIVLILSEADLTDKIVAAIREDLEIDKPGNGVIYVKNVNATYGLFK